MKKGSSFHSFPTVNKSLNKLTDEEKKIHSQSTTAIPKNQRKTREKSLQMQRMDLSHSNLPDFASINDSDENNEITYLITKEQDSSQFKRGSWWDKLYAAKEGAVNLIKKIANGVKYVISNPRDCALAITTAAPTAINALAAPSRRPPAELGAAWWDEMSAGKRTESILNGSSSLLINGILTLLFLPKAWNKLKAAYRVMFNSVRELLETITALLIALIGVIPLATIAYKAFRWLPNGQYTSFVPAIINYVVNLASRFIGGKAFLERFLNLFNEDAKTQKDLYETLAHVRQEEHLNTLIDLFEESKEELFSQQDLTVPLTEAEFQTLVDNFIDRLAKLPNGNLSSMTSDSTRTEYALEWADRCFDVAWASVASSAAFMIFMYEGYSGLKIFSDLCLGIDLDDPNVLDDWSRRSIGLVPGIASALFYFTFNLDLRETLADLLEHLKRYPSLLPSALIVLAANYCASSSMENVTNSMTAHENITGIDAATSPETATTLAIMMRIAAGGVNLKGTVEKAFLSPPSLEELQYADFVRSLRKIHEHPLDHDTANKVRVNLFNKSTSSNSGMVRSGSFTLSM